uniref:glutathione transferase n=1 Tax=Erpetoichthys calabaricus TaxID=27687 RepID=A0A8C4RM94_ERPCA
MYNCKLTYFNMRGRAELARYIFAYAGMKYEDIRVEWKDWPEIKQTIPFEKLPIMEVDGIIIPQSLAIARYLAKETGLAGATNLEEAQTDALVDCMNDFTIMIPWNEKNKEVKLFLIHSPVLMKNLTKALGEKTWLVGESVTWADFYWEICFTTLNKLKENFAEEYTQLIFLKDRVKAIPEIAEWIKKRPSTEF